MAGKEIKEKDHIVTRKKKGFVVSSTIKHVLIAATISLFLILGIGYCVSHFIHGIHQFARRASAASDDDAEIYASAAVAADAITCSEVGVDILKKNGSVVDAAIASCFCLGVINMHSSGLGGGGVMLVYIRENQTFEAFDYRERAPFAATEDFYKDKYNQTLREGQFFANSLPFKGTILWHAVLSQRARAEMSRQGPLSIAVPGEVRGMHAAWKKYGKLPWRDLIEPTINMTESGFHIQLRLHEAMEKFRDILEADESFSNLLIKNGTLRRLGSALKMPNMTRTLRKIQEDPEDFYVGSIAREIVEDMKDIGGIMNAEDLERCKVRHRDVIKYRLGNYTLHTMTSPFGGPIVLHVLNILKGYNFTAEDLADDEKALITYQRIAEALKFAYAERTKEGDPDYIESDIIKMLHYNVTSEEIGEDLRRKISDFETYNVSHYGPELAQPMEEGTTHVSLIAPNGDAVSVTHTINEWFGAGYRSLRNGIIFNNEMNDFAIPGGNLDGFPPAPSNFIKPGKIPLSSSAPVIITDDNGDVKMVLGASGGTRIISAVAFVIMNTLWFGEELGHAVSRPRFYHQLVPNQITIEASIPMPDKIVEGLKRLGHAINVTDRPEYSSVQAICVENKNRILAKSDPRKYGNSAGF
eukprot:gene14205-15687_t